MSVVLGMKMVLMVRMSLRIDDNECGARDEGSVDGAGELHDGL